MLIYDIEEDEYAGFEGGADLDNFDCEVSVTFPSEEKRAYAEKCVEYMQNLDEDTMKRLAKYSYRYYSEFCSMLEEADIEELEMPQDVSEQDILDYVYLNTIIVEEECREDRVEFHVECNCDWEIEHGLEFTISDGKILYLGGFNDVPPYMQARLDNFGFYNEKADFNMNYADKE